MPYLVELAVNADVPDRAEIVLFLALVAREAKTLNGRNVHPAWPSAWAAAVPELIGLLDDGEVSVRRAAAYARAPRTRT